MILIGCILKKFLFLYFLLLLFNLPLKAQQTDTICIYDYQFNDFGTQKIGLEPIIIYFSKIDSLILDAGKGERIQIGFRYWKNKHIRIVSMLAGVRIIKPRDSACIVRIVSNENYPAKKQYYRLDTIIDLNQLERPYQYWMPAAVVIKDSYGAGAWGVMLKQERFTNKEFGSHYFLRRSSRRTLLKQMVLYEYDYRTRTLTTIKNVTDSSSKKIHASVFAGYTRPNFNRRGSSPQNAMGSGFRTGVIFSKPVSRFLDLQTQIIYNNRGSLPVLPDTSLAFNVSYVELWIAPTFRLNRTNSNAYTALTFAFYTGYGSGRTTQNSQSVRLFDQPGTNRFDAGLAMLVGFQFQKGLFFNTGVQWAAFSSYYSNPSVRKSSFMNWSVNMITIGYRFNQPVLKWK